MISALTLISLIIAAVVWFVYTQRSRRRLAGFTWDQLLRQFQEVPASGIATVALDYLQPGHNQLAIEPEVIFQLLGGHDGLQRMAANVEVMLQLAAVAEQWNPEESIIVGERMRREALKLRQAVGRVRRSMRWHYGQVSIPFDMQEAASVYYLMRERLLALYGASHIGRHQHLALVLGS